MSELRAGTPVVSGDWTIVPIEAICRASHVGHGGFWVSAYKRPVAVVLLARTERGVETTAIDISGSALDAGRLAAEVPGLQELLDDCLNPSSSRPAASA